MAEKAAKREVKKTSKTRTPKTEATGSEAAHVGKAERMRQHLEKQPKVPIMIPLLPGEVEGSTESVILNGHRLNIRKGDYVMVPQQVAQVIMESQQKTQEAINNYFLMNEQGVSKAMKAKTA